MSKAEKANIKTAGKYCFMRRLSGALVACKFGAALCCFEICPLGEHPNNFWLLFVAKK